MRGRWGPQTNIFYIVCVVLVVIYLFYASWGLNHPDISVYDAVQAKGYETSHPEFDSLAMPTDPYEGHISVELSQGILISKF